MRPEVEAIKSKLTHSIIEFPRRVFYHFTLGLLKFSSTYDRPSIKIYRETCFYKILCAI